MLNPPIFGGTDEVGKEKELEVGFEGLVLQMRESEGFTGIASDRAMIFLYCF